MNSPNQLLAPWIQLAELPARHPELASTTDAARWQRRILGPELVKHQALTVVCGRLYVHPERWAAAVIEGGQRLVTQRQPRKPRAAGAAS